MYLHCPQSLSGYKPSKCKKKACVDKLSTSFKWIFLLTAQVKSKIHCLLLLFFTKKGSTKSHIVMLNAGMKVHQKKSHFGALKSVFGVAKISFYSSKMRFFCYLLTKFAFFVIRWQHFFTLLTLLWQNLHFFRDLLTLFCGKFTAFSWSFDEHSMFFVVLWQNLCAYSNLLIFTIFGQNMCFFAIFWPRLFIFHNIRVSSAV